MRKWLAFFVVTVCSSFLHAQKQGSIWYFGYKAGINFNTTPPTALTDGALFSYEACASIADQNGNLLFYTDGSVIYNKQHQIMDNGSGLMGNQSSAQGAVIIPWPERDSLYYIITADASENAGAAGYTYSIVDITKNNSLGSVIEKNKLLYAPSTEKLTVARHQNKRDWWLITKAWGNNEYRVYLIDQNGINSTPVISSIGSLLNGDLSKMGGCMKISPDDKKLATTISDNTTTASYLEIFDFNNANGKLSNSIHIKENEPYGLEFSSDSRLLYVSNKDLNNPYERKIDQFDIGSATNAISLEATRTTITPTGYNKFPMGLQMGPDNKIYIAAIFNDKVDAITLPNNKGFSCNLQKDVIDLQGGIGKLMFPTIVSNLLTPPTFTVNATISIIDPCNREVQLTAASTQTTNVTYKWDLGNGSTSFSEDVTAVYPFTKDVFDIQLEVTADVPTSSGSQRTTKSITQQIQFNPLPKADAGKDMAAIAGQPVQLNGKGGVTFVWSPSQYLDNSSIANPIATLQADQVFTLEVRNADGCIDEDQVNVTVYKEVAIYVPTGFTPNGDGKNDLLKSIPVGVQLQGFSIYNRWGNLVFFTKDPTRGWNGMLKGKRQPEGAYVWIATGTDFKGQPVLKKGTTVLMR